MKWEVWYKLYELFTIRTHAEIMAADMDSSSDDDESKEDESKEPIKTPKPQYHGESVFSKFLPYYNRRRWSENDLMHVVYMLNLFSLNSV